MGMRVRGLSRSNFPSRSLRICSKDLTFSFPCSLLLKKFKVFYNKGQFFNRIYARKIKNLGQEEKFRKLKY